MIKKDKLTMIVHGEAKAGKSWFAATSPFPTLVLDVENGWEHIPKSPALRKVHGKKFRMIEWNPTKDPMPEFDGTWDICQVHALNWRTIETTYRWLNEQPHQFKSVIMDSITGIQGRLIENIKPNPLDALQMQDWGTALRVMESTVVKFRDLPSNSENTIQVMVFVAQTVSNGVPEKYRPAMKGQIKADLPYRTDVIGYLYATADKTTEGTDAGTRTRQLLISPHPKYEAGSRFEEILGACISNPNVQNILKIINEDTE